MVRKHHKVLSLILCLILAVSAICCGTVGATAATGNTIYFRPGHWTDAGAWFSVYAWNDSTGQNTFVKMSEVESGVYGADLGGSYPNVIFCRNDPAKTAVDWASAWNQTADLTVQSGSNCFAVNSGEWTGANGSWSTYNGGDIVVTDPVPTNTNPVDTTDPTTTVSGTSIFFDANHWTDAGAWFAVYAWNDSTGANTFVKMTNVSGTIYGADLGGSYPNVIFCRMDPAKTAVDWASAWNQTADLTVQSGCNKFTVNSGEWTGANGTWSVYGDNPILPTDPNPTNPNPTNPVIVPGTYTVYCKNTAGWSKVNCYMWNSETDANATWPGAAMTNIGDNVWMYTASKAFSGCIFNDGSTQTTDLEVKYGYIYDNSTNTWEVYDTNPIQVTAYSADPASDIYVGTDVNLTATATAATTVYYQFTVTNANGDSSVVSNFSSASNATWTPSVAGTYTIKFDFKDDEGNENSRSISVTVSDDTGLAKPIIKSVIPTNFGFIKVGNNATVSVKAGGGITGTNLLFYKYIVKDPNGVENTPYYTLNNTYTFKPTMVGKYTVEVFVQASDNVTVSRTYTYNATTEDVTLPSVIVPTDPKPTVPDVILGDVDNDGRVSVKDATWLQKHLVGYEGYENVELAVADVDNDGRVSVKDATAIQRMCLE